MSEKDDTLNENPLSRALNIASGILGSSQESVPSSSSKASPMQDSEDGAKEELAGMLLKCFPTDHPKPQRRSLPTAKTRKRIPKAHFPRWLPLPRHCHRFFRPSRGKAI